MQLSWEDFDGDSSMLENASMYNDLYGRELDSAL